MRVRPIAVSSLIALAAVFSLGGAARAADDCHDSPRAGIDWRDCNKRNLMLPGGELRGANLTNVDFSGTDLGGSDLVSAIFEKATLVRANLAGSQASGTRFARVEAYRTDFSEINAPGAIFRSGELQRSNFHAAVLTDVDFTKADMGRSQFDKADVSGSRFALANLARADFRGAKFAKGADFDRAFFFLTRIEGVDLSTATGLNQWQIDMACGDKNTRLPQGLKPSKGWPCKFGDD
jgi:uncharacterized protein YjbI with pentapeptide repeats